MSKPSPTQTNTQNNTSKNKLLIGILVGVVVVYLVLLPWIKKMNAETKKLESEAQQNTQKVAEISKVKEAVETSISNAKTSTNPVEILQAASQAKDAGKTDDAIALIEKALTIKPDDADTLLLLADVNSLAKRHYEAMDAYKRILAKDPDNLRAITGLGYIYVSFAWTMEARDLLEATQKKFPQNPQIGVVLTMAYLQHNEFSIAEKTLLKVRALAPQDAALWSPLADVYNKQRNYVKAIQAAEDALLLMPDDPRLLNELASAYYAKGDNEKAIESALKIIAKYPDELRAHYSLALVYQRLKKREEFVKELELIYKISPEYENTRLLLGQAYLQEKRVEESKKLLADYKIEVDGGQNYAKVGHLLATTRNDVKAHFEMALVYQQQKNTPRMIMEAKKTLEIQPNHQGAKDLISGSTSAINSTNAGGN